MGRRERLYSDPIASALSASNREVLVAVCEGKTNAEIARARGRAVSTVKHAVTELLHAFGVDSRHALMVECARRHIGAD